MFYNLSVCIFGFLRSAYAGVRPGELPPWISLRAVYTVRGGSEYGSRLFRLAVRGGESILYVFLQEVLVSNGEFPLVLVAIAFSFVFGGLCPVRRS